MRSHSASKLEIQMYSGIITLITLHVLIIFWPKYGHEYCQKVQDIQNWGNIKD
jgi:hypothetical protein